MTVDRDVASLKVGQSTHQVSIPVTLQRLVMEAGANRDLSLIHHDGEAARLTGARDAYANTFFLMGMCERLLREWMGPSGRIVKLGPLKMKAFNVVGDTLTFSGTVGEVDIETQRCRLDLPVSTDSGPTASCAAIVEMTRQA